MHSMLSVLERELGLSLAQYRTLDLHAQCPVTFSISALGSIPTTTRRRGREGKEEEKVRRSVKLLLRPFFINYMHFPNYLGMFYLGSYC